MALEGNFRRKFGSQDKPPVLKGTVRHGDRVVLAGNRVPRDFSRKKIAALRAQGYID